MATSPALSTKTNDHGGPLDALANYWITKLKYEETGESKAAPEFNLHLCGASEALAQYIGTMELLETSIAFDLGLRIAGIVMRNHLDAGEEIREAIKEAVEDSSS